MCESTCQNSFQFLTQQAEVLESSSSVEETTSECQTKTSAKHKRFASSNSPSEQQKKQKTEASAPKPNQLKDFHSVPPPPPPDSLYADEDDEESVRAKKEFLEAMRIMEEAGLGRKRKRLFITTDPNGLCQNALLSVFYL